MISQSDIDSLLGTSSSEETTGAFEQSEIDALLGEIEELGPKLGEPLSGKPAKASSETTRKTSADPEDADLIVDQSAIDALLAEAQDSGNVKAPAATRSAARVSFDKGSYTAEHPSEEGIVNQSDLDALLSQETVSEKEIDEEAEAALDPSSVEELLAQIQTETKPAATAGMEENDTLTAGPESAQKDAADLSPTKGSPLTENTAIDQSSIDDLFSEEAVSEKDLEVEAQAALDQSSVEELLAQIETDTNPAEAMVTEENDTLTAGPQAALDQSSVEELLTRIETDTEPVMEAAPEEKEQLETHATPVNVPSGTEEEAPFAPEEMPAAEEAADSPSAEIPLAPDLEAGDVPLEIELPPVEPVPDQQCVVDAIVEATRKKVSLNIHSTDKDQTSPDERVRTGVSGTTGKEAALRPQDIGRERILEERGEAKILDTSYRIYACVKGNYELLSESNSLEEAKEKLMSAWMDHARKEVVIKRVTRKEVLVIKEDLDDVPVRLEVALDS